jgi:hypothetical protein
MGDRTQGPRQQGKAEDSKAAKKKTLTGKKWEIRAWLQGRPNAQGPGERRSGSPEQKGPAFRVKRRSGTKKRGGGRRGDAPPRV